jgi:hypothetical protein
MNEQRQCEAFRKDGARCRAKALPGRPWCFTHDPEMADRRRRARAIGGRKAAQARKLNNMRADLSDPAALLRFTSDLIQDVLARRVDVSVGRCALYGVSVLRQVVEAADLAKRVEALEQQIMERNTMS